MDKSLNYLNKKKKLFIVDDDDFYINLLVEYFKKHKIVEVKAFSNIEDFSNALNENPDYVLLDYYLTDNNDEAESTGLDALKAIKKECPDSVVIILSGQKKSDIVMKLIDEGAENYIIKDSNTFSALDDVFNDILFK